MSELISAGILAGLALWGFGCHWALQARERKAAIERPEPRSSAALNAVRRRNELQQPRFKKAVREYRP